MKWIEVFLEFKKPEALSGNNGKNLVETHRIVNSSVLQLNFKFKATRGKKVTDTKIVGGGEKKKFTS